MGNWANFMEEYIYVEKSMTTNQNSSDGENVSADNGKGYRSDRSLWTILRYQIGYFWFLPYWVS